MDSKEVAEILANGAFGMTQVLAPHYRTEPADRDYFIWDSYAFLLAYFYTFDGLNQQEVIELISQLSQMYPDPEHQNLSRLWLLTATQFYGTHIWDIKINKNPMPDVIIYNLCHTASEKKEELPILECDLIELADLWTKLITYMTNGVIPKFNNYFHGDET